MKRLIFILFGFMVFTGVLEAAIGKFVAVSGDVSIERAEKVIAVKTGIEVEESDIVRSGSEGKAQLLFSDNTVITIGKSSELKLAEFSFGEGKEPKAQFNFATGTFRSITGKIGKVAPKSFKLKTKTATIGIRGTGILGQITPEEEKIACTQGAISVTSLGTGQSVDVPSGQITSVEPGQPPTPPRVFRGAAATEEGAPAEEEQPAEEEGAPAPGGDADNGAGDGFDAPGEGDVDLAETFDAPAVDLQTLGQLVEDVQGEAKDTGEEVSDAITGDVVEAILEEVLPEPGTETPVDELAQTPPEVPTNTGYVQVDFNDIGVTEDDPDLDGTGWGDLRRIDAGVCRLYRRRMGQRGRHSPIGDRRVYRPGLYRHLLRCDAGGRQRRRRAFRYRERGHGTDGPVRAG